MQKKFAYILVLMSLCVLGVTALQFYWNYKNYQYIVVNFKTAADDALDQAVIKEIKERRKGIVSEFKHWMADTTFIKITCDTINHNHSTSFTFRDAVPYRQGEKADRRTITIDSFNKKLGKITPSAKKMFIDYIAKLVEDEMRVGIVYYYTQALGNRLTKRINESRLSLSRLEQLFKKELTKRRISTKFKLFQKKQSMPYGFITPKINASFSRPYRNEMVWASLETPASYYLREMKWLIISSILLIGITFCCFFYTIKTLFSQYKLLGIKNQFIQNMTHEINTPLASIRLTTEALQRFDYNIHIQEAYLDIIAYQTNKLGQLTNEILEEAKLDRLTIDISETINLYEIVEQVYTETCNKGNIKFNTSKDLKDWFVKGNRRHMYRSILNLVDNALKYNNNCTVEIQLKKTETVAEILVKDNGTGIPDAYKKKIFEQFYRIPTGDVHNTKGYGLGLSYVSKVISQHHGRISVYDNLPSGTVFSIKIPA